ncbi:hypothetical protein [Micromonospora sp. DT233]|uniref:hypothetical protein n=1 Tax=Micromonospora sp. DT233 TaxID=3393432 RepID=UPI003CFACB96
MQSLLYSAIQFAVQLPTLLVLVAGVVLAVLTRDRLPRRSRTLLVCGALVLLVGALLNLAWLVVIPRLHQSGTSAGDIGWLSGGLGLVSAVLNPVGLGLLVAAALTGRRPNA